MLQIYETAMEGYEATLSPLKAATRPGLPSSTGFRKAHELAQEKHGNLLGWKKRYHGLAGEVKYIARICPPEEESLSLGSEPRLWASVLSGRRASRIWAHNRASFLEYFSKSSPSSSDRGLMV
jgi:hypothetical protein